MANQKENKVYERDEKVELYVDGRWLPAVVRNVRPMSASASSDAPTLYTVAPDLAGQPQFTGRPAQFYPPFRGVTSKSLRARGSSADSSDTVDVMTYVAGTTNSMPGNLSAPHNLKNLGIDQEAGEKRSKAAAKDSKLSEAELAESSLQTGFQQAVKSDADGNVNHGANASVQLVGDVTGTNGTGAVNANGEVPAADPNTPVNQTPYTVEASNDPALGLDKTNIPNTGVAPLVVGADPELAPQGKTGNPSPVNPTEEEGKDGKVIASDRYDGALASATPVGSKDDKQTAEALAKDGEKDSVPDQKYPAIDNEPLNTGEANPAKDADGTHGTTASLVKPLDPKDAEQMTSDTDPMKPTKQAAEDVAKVHSATGDDNPQLPATDTSVTDGNVDPEESKPGVEAAKEHAAKDKASKKK